MYSEKLTTISVLLFVVGSIMIIGSQSNEITDHTRSNLLTGSFVIASDYIDDREGYDSLLAEMKNMGMNKVILHSIGIVYDNGTYVRTVSDSTLSWMLSDAANLSMDVFIGLYWSNQSNFWNNPIKDVLIQQDNIAVKQIENLYGDRANLKGYYIVQEVFVGEHYLPLLDDLFTPLIQRLHQNTSRPIMVSGYMDPKEYGDTPNDIENWLHDFIFGSSNNQGCDVDIFLLQDGVGSFDNRLIWTHGYYLYDYFLAAKNGTSPKQLWADVELFQWNYVRNSSIDNNWYHPSCAMRINNQIYQINLAGVDEKITWINQHHMTNFVKNNFPEQFSPEEARHLYRGYMALYYWGNYYDNPTYYAIPKPSAQYPDTGGMLFDNVIGEEFYDEWVGWNLSQGSNVSIIIDLGSEKPVTDVTAVVRTDKNAAIYYPKSMKVEISSDNISYTTIGIFQNPYSDMDKYSKADFWISTDTVHYARYVKITFKLGGYWLFISELEVYGVENIAEFHLKMIDILILIILLPEILVVFKNRFV